MIDPLTGRTAVRTVRTVSRFPMSDYQARPPLQYLRVPRVGNMVGAVTLRLPDALKQTVQSTHFELYVGVIIDGQLVPVEVELEDFYVEPVE